MPDEAVVETVPPVVAPVVAPELVEVTAAPEDDVEVVAPLVVELPEEDVDAAEVVVAAAPLEEVVVEEVETTPEDIPEEAPDVVPEVAPEAVLVPLVLLPVLFVPHAEAIAAARIPISFAQSHLDTPVLDLRRPRF